MPLGLSPIINGIRDSVENAQDLDALKRSLQRVIEAFEAVDDFANQQAATPTLPYGFLLHRIERAEDLPNALELVAEDDTIVLTPLAGKRQLLIRAEVEDSGGGGGGHPIWVEDFEPVEILNGDGVTQLFGNWRWWDPGGGNWSLVAPDTSVVTSAWGVLLVVKNNAGFAELRPYQPTQENAWFHSTALFDTIIRATFDLDTPNGDEDIRFGYTGNTSAGAVPANGIYFENLNNEANWFGVCRAAGSQNRVDTGVAFVDDDTGVAFLNFRIRRVNGTTIGFTAPGGSEVTQTLTIPNRFLDPWIAFDGGSDGNIAGWFDYWDIDFPDVDRGL